MSADPVTYRSANGIATITINRAEGMNRLDDAVAAGLHQAWRRLMTSQALAPIAKIWPVREFPSPILLGARLRGCSGHPSDGCRPRD